MWNGAPFRVGLIGTGRISDIYLKTCARFSEIEIAVCGSLNSDEARAKAASHGLARVATPEEIIADPSLDAILNLTIPAAHAEISHAALEAGKHVYSEKPIATSLEEGRKVLELAHTKGLLVGNAPDTFLGGRWQTVRKLLDQHAIGRPLGAMAYVTTRGVERHNPNPDFYYQRGGGPLLDLGPYYLSVMVFLLGPMARVSGMARQSFDERQIECGPRSGERIGVDVDTHSLSMIEFQSGVLASMTMSFDVWESDTPRFEVYGENGTICVPDPDPVHGANLFHGPIWYRTRADSRWEVQPRPTGRQNWRLANNTHGFNEDSRGLGLLDLAYAAQEGRLPRASGEMAYHVLEAMVGITEAPKRGGFVDLESSCTVPSILPETFPEARTQEPAHAN